MIYLEIIDMELLGQSEWNGSVETSKRLETKLKWEVKYSSTCSLLANSSSLSPIVASIVVIVLHGGEMKSETFWSLSPLLQGPLFLSASAFSHLPNQQQRTQEKVYALPNRPHNTLTVWLMVMEFNLSLTLHLLTFLTWLVSILIG